MMSTPSEFVGDAAGRNMSGALSLTLAPPGKEITRVSATEALSATVPLHCRETGGGAGRAAPATQAPAFAAVVVALDQQLHAEQPATSSAEEAQQQPPRHRLVPQSAAEAHSSPGELRTQVPVLKWHAPQPCRTAFWVQQLEPRQAPEAQLALEAQGSPGARELTGAREVVGVRVGDAEGVGVAVLTLDAVGGAEAVAEAAQDAVLDAVAVCDASAAAAERMPDPEALPVAVVVAEAVAEPQRGGAGSRLSAAGHVPSRYTPPLDRVAQSTMAMVPGSQYMSKSPAPLLNLNCSALVVARDTNHHMPSAVSSMGHKVQLPPPSREAFSCAAAQYMRLTST
jgi:hypothetical protein